MMFKGEDQQGLETVIENSIITLEDQKIPLWVLNVTQITITDEEHLWHFTDELLLDIR